MMKKITLLFALLIASIGFSQDLLLGFEAAESGGLDGGPFGNGNALAVNLVTGTGTNTTQVVEFIANSAGEIWQGININLTTDVDLTSTQTMTIDVKSATAISFLAKVNDGTGDEAAAAVTHNGDNTWQTLSFTFDTVLDGKAPAANGIYNGFVIHAYWAPGATTFGEVTADERTFYVDNIKGPESTAETCSDGIMNNMETGVDCGGPNCGACPSPPTTAAPTPPARPAADVISIYGDAYGAVEGLNGVPWDGGSESVEENHASNDVLKITNGTNDFIGFDVGNTDGFIDAADMTYVHVDFYLDTDYVVGQVVKVKLSNHANLPGTPGETSAIIPEAFPGASDVRTWYSFDLPLGTGDRDKVAQLLLIYTHSTGAPSRIYVDNFYFHKNTLLSTQDFNKTNFSVYPNPSLSSWTVKTQDAHMSSIKVFDVLGKNVLSLAPNKTETVIDGSSLRAGLYFAQIKTESGINSIKLIKN